MNGFIITKTMEYENNAHDYSMTVQKLPFYRNFTATNPGISATIIQNTVLLPALISSTLLYPHSFFISLVG